MAFWRDIMQDIVVRGLGYSYKNGKKVLKDINFQLEKGKCLGIVGPNGSGKTTLCYCLCGIIPHYFKGTMEGEVFINGKNTRCMPLNSMAQDIGIVLQNPNDQLMMPTVEDEIAFGLENYLLGREEMKERIDDVIKQLEIGDIRSAHPADLSGGQKQLVALAATLALQPNIIIFDESLSMLDECASMRIIKVMKQLKEQGKTLLIIDHTLQAFDIFDHVMVIKDGSIELKGNKESPEIKNACRGMIIEDTY